MIRALVILGGLAGACTLAVVGYAAPASPVSRIAPTSSTPSIATTTAAVPQVPTLSPLSISPLPSTSGATSPAPVTVPTSSTAPSPTAAPIAAGPDGYEVPWSADDCGWAESTLSWDSSLDAQEATAIEDGQDTRYPGQASLYTTYSGRWTMIASWYAAACQGSAMIYPEWYDSMVWMNAAIQSHVTDEQANTADALWDSTWIGNYQRLESMLADVSGEWPTS
jgi:hypothetical protein